MATTRLEYVFIVLLAFISSAALGLGLSNSDAAAQGARSVTPEGFEFSTTTPVLKYHFPRRGVKASVFRGTWIAENVEGVRPNSEIDSAEAKLSAEPVIFFSLTRPETNWPGGLYRLEIRADEKLVHTERFMIR
jgi:hypothetical protein